MKFFSKVAEWFSRVKLFLYKDVQEMVKHKPPEHLMEVVKNMDMDYVHLADNFPPFEQKTMDQILYHQKVCKIYEDLFKELGGVPTSQRAINVIPFPSKKQQHL